MPNFPSQSYARMEAADLVAAVAHLYNANLKTMCSGGSLPDMRAQQAREIAMYALSISLYFKPPQIAKWFKVSDRTVRETLKRLERPNDPRMKYRRERASEAVGYLRHHLDAAAARERLRSMQGAA